MIIDPERTDKCASLLDATDSHVKYAEDKLRSTGGKDLGELTAVMDGARQHALGSLGVVRAVQREISQGIRVCTQAFVAQDHRNAQSLHDVTLPFPTLG